ncbi:MAG: hypothetical protein ACK5L5_07820, partial [Bacteroidales bacterium]
MKTTTHRTGRMQAVVLSFCLAISLLSCGEKKRKAKLPVNATEVSVVEINPMDLSTNTPYAARITGIINSDVRAKV